MTDRIERLKAAVDAECRAAYRAERRSLVLAVYSAEDRLDGTYDIEPGDPDTGHAILAAAQRALEAFDAATDRRLDAAEKVVQQ